MNKTACVNCQKDREESEMTKTEKGLVRCIYCIERARKMQEDKLAKSKVFCDFMQDLADAATSVLEEVDDIEAEEQSAAVADRLQDALNRERVRLGNG